MADSNITKRALAAALKSLLAERPFAKVSVREICEACGMSRKSFYYHFQDKYELLNWIFFTEFVSRIRTGEEENAWMLMAALCDYFYENRGFYRRAFEVEGQNSFCEYFREILGVLLQSEMEMIFGSEEDIAFCTDFYLDALTSSVRRWLKAREPVSAAVYVRQLRRCIMAVSRRVLDKYQQDADGE